MDNPGDGGPISGHSVIPLALVLLGMPDDKQGRDDQADNAERRQRERELQEARDRADEPEPVAAESNDQLGALDDALETHDYPTTAAELVSAYGDREVETQDGSKTVDEVLGPVGDESYDSADEVRNRIRRLVHR